MRIHPNESYRGSEAFGTDPVAKNLPKIIGDERALIQAVLNLMVNAAHAISERKPEAGRIKLRTERIRDNIQLAIEDNGIGIPKSFEHRIDSHNF